MDDYDKKAYEIVASHAEKELPQLKRSRDGFSRNDVVNAFARAFEMIGGVQRLAIWADANPDKFYPLYSRLLPAATIQIGNAKQVNIVHSLAPTNLDQHPLQEDDSGSEE